MRKKPNLNEVVARNLAYLMGRPGCLYNNPTALARAALVAPNTVRNLLDPTRRTKLYAHTSKREGYPNLDMLERIADKLGCEVWELIHPNIEQAQKAQEIYESLEATFHIEESDESTGKTDEAA